MREAPKRVPQCRNFATSSTAETTGGGLFSLRIWPGGGGGGGGVWGAQGSGGGFLDPFKSVEQQLGGVELAASAEFTGNLAGIAGATYRRVQAPPPEPVAGPIPPKSDKIKIDIVYDATPSMRGFTEAGESGLYTRVLRKPESAAAKEWPGTEVQLFRFGSEITPLTSQDRLAPLRTSFYETRQGFIDTHIDRAVEAGTRVHLTGVLH